jgi:MGT family glycosyltransferase
MRQTSPKVLSLFFAMPKIQKDLKRLQARGYPVKNILEIISNDDTTDTIVYTSAEFQPCAETFSEKYAFVGPSVRPAEAVVEKTREKLVYISMGTVNNDLLPLYQNCIKALEGSDYQVILSVGSQVDVSAFGVLPETVTVYPSVDQIAVLEKADVFLTHCGMNSVSEALYFGVPLLMLPQTKEQQGVAERVRQLGAGILLEETTSERIRQSVENLLGKPEYGEAAQAVRESFRRCGGAKAAADKIESCCRP